MPEAAGGGGGSCSEKVSVLVLLSCDS